MPSVAGPSTKLITRKGSEIRKPRKQKEPYAQSLTPFCTDFRLVLRPFMQIIRFPPDNMMMYPTDQGFIALKDLDHKQESMICPRSDRCGTFHKSQTSIHSPSPLIHQAKKNERNSA